MEVLTEMRDEVADAALKLQAEGTPAAKAKLTALARLDEARDRAMGGMSKTLSSDWGEAQAKAADRMTAAYTQIRSWVAEGRTPDLASIAKLNQLLRPPDGAKAVVRAGEYRQLGKSKQTKFLGNCMPMPHLAEAMKQVVAFLGAAQDAGMPPLELAGRAYHHLVNIHPFSDGNGRTARAVMDWILLAAGFEPVALADPKVLSYDASTGQTAPRRVQKSVTEVLDATTKHLEAKLAVVRGEGGPLAAVPANLELLQPRPMTKLEDGAQAFGNRKYTFASVPSELSGWGVTQLDGGKPVELRARAASAGQVFVAVAPEQDGYQELSASEGWQPLPELGFHYSDRGQTKLEVFSRHLEEDQELQLSSSTWAGTLLLVPPS